ncbi:MAG: winged helix-turn-helix transcriptional regulator [Acidimicrobiaceae bacterium]|nr:winged helix-turn-helix transcriptional regulator [Acidimicrobiaceae bacterium]
MSKTSAFEALDSELFTAKVTSLTHSFGDSTRRKIYFHVREHPGVTVAQLADHCGVHTNVVRHHLDRLIESGYMAFDNVRTSSVGRPAKIYRVVNADVTLEGSLRRDALLVSLLEGALERLGPAASEQLAHDVGLDYGRSLSGLSDPSNDPRAVMSALAGLLKAHGFDAEVQEQGSSTSIVTKNCPFGAAAQQHPVLCAVDRGLVAGLLEGLGSSSTHVTLTSRARGDADCRVTA